ncbi:MAG: sigma-70 family RNA polymerase sigma factor [Pirellulaceae bacterium]|nr:sigma-70 family RNA polymerase sigma factor [Pirellulaceae bacterium]
MTRLDAVSQTKNDTPHNDDRVLVDRLVRGDSDAWQVFVQTYSRLIRARVADVAASFGRAADTTTMDDAVAEVFAALLMNDAAALRGFAGRSSLVTYLAVIATRSATRGFARRVNVTHEDPSQSEYLADPTLKDPIGELIRTERCNQVQKLLDQLPAKQRDVVRMFHLHQRSYAQISQSLGIPIGSVGPTLRRGEAKLREWIES